jgi:DNA gyrase/topoisomerase IV subunit B
MWDETYGRTKMHLAVDQMHSGSNFEGGDTSVGQNGVGLKGCNALSSKFWVITSLNDTNSKDSSPTVTKFYTEGDKGKYYAIYYEEGVIKDELVSTLKDINSEFKIDLPLGYSTYVVSYPDPKIYENPVANLDPKRIGTSILIFEKFYKRKIQYILDGKQIKSNDSSYKYSTLVEYKVPGLTKDGARDDDNLVDMKLLLNYEFDSDLEVMSSGGNINTRNVPRGYHINMGRDRLANALKKVFEIPHNHLQKGMKLEALLLAPGAQLQLAGQTKDSLIRIKCFTDKHWDMMEKALVKDLTKNKEELGIHIQRLNEYAMTLDKLAAKDYVKSMISMSKNSGPIISRKVRDASSMNRDECSLFIVEGNSAASSLLDARNPMIHAVFAMRGFCLNTVGKSLEQVFENEEFKDLVSAIGLNEPLDKVIYHDHFFNCWELLETKYSTLRQSAAKLTT